MASQRRRVVVLGSTGSIGVQALGVIAGHPDRFELVALTAQGSSPDLLIEQARATGVLKVGVTDSQTAAQIRAALPGVEVIDGSRAAQEIAGLPADVVLNGITGSIGLRPTLAALKAGSLLALANKESMVAGGPLVKAAARAGQIIPVDSEHSAIAQALRAGAPGEVSRLILTASGGPFRGRDRASLATIGLNDALAHPTWQMGQVVTINSATLVNKGLELIEAHLLFDIPYSRIETVVHPQSVVHSLVEFIDGSTIAQVSPPTMRIPIALALSWPERLALIAPPCDWRQSASWTFEPIDQATFPAVQIARHAGEAGGIAPAAFNAANEECVSAFISGELSFLGISLVLAEIVEDVVAGANTIPRDVEDVIEAEVLARGHARGLIRRLAR
jgi:1-deoxy-D-xylulose-5-phosphate reductoisomerase